MQEGRKKKNCHHFKNSLLLKLCRLSLSELLSLWLRSFHILCKGRLRINKWGRKEKKDSRQNGFKQPAVRSQICSLCSYLALSLLLTQFADCCDIFVTVEKCSGWFYCGIFDEYTLSSSLSGRGALKHEWYLFLCLFEKLSDWFEFNSSQIKPVRMEDFV